MAEENFKWTDFYSEFATKLLNYRNNRTELIEKIKKVYENIGLKLPTLDEGDDPKDIDPFTVFGLFNRNINDLKRIRIIRGMADTFSIAAEVPENFEGIPVMQSMNATFYGFGGNRKEGDIDRLWNAFDAAIGLADENTPEHRAAFSSAYDAVIPQFGVKWKITMGLFWIRPYFYVSLDQKNRWFLTLKGSMPDEFIKKVEPLLKDVPTSSEYLEIRNLCLDVLESGSYPYRNLPELSYYALKIADEYNEKNKEETKEESRKIRNTLGDADVNKVHYWVYAPGEGAAKWEEFYQKGVAALNYHELGNFSLYESREEMAQKFREETYSNSSFSQSTLACWQFVHEMKPGDIIYAKKGRSEIVGRGTVESDYIYDEVEPSGYKSKRKVKWTNKGSWHLNFVLGMKTLTDITDYTSQRKEIEALFEGENGGEDLTEDPEIYPEYPAYDREDFLEEVYLAENEYQTLTGLLDRKKNVILQGPPGVGKTFAAKRLAYSIMGVKDADRVELVQFHQSYSYEDFVMGFRPSAGGSFEIRTGAFYDFCRKAADDSGNKYFFIIDEINRGNLSKIFGELFMLIEGDKRGSGNKIRLLYSDELFYVPENLYLIGMMNTADRSLAMLDYALRRRFAFFDLKPAFSAEGFRTYQDGLHNEKFNRLIQTVENLNRVITDDDSLGEGFCIGHSYFCGLTERSLTDRTLTDIVEYELIPLLKEYWFDEPEKVQEWSGRLRSVLK